MGRAVGGNVLMEQRIAAAEGLADADGHGLAGFLDAEGCFQIRPNNRGRTCMELARLLREFPLRARKRRDFEIWAGAVDRWAAIPYDAKASGSFHAAMADDAAALRDVRRYVKSPPPALDGPAADLVAHRGGFFSGEGCFGLSGLQPRAVVKLRGDDRGILDLFAERFGIGTVRDHRPYGNPNPSVT